MKPDPLPPSDSELDRLLASRLKRTSPEFELRWRALRGELVGRRPSRQRRWPQWILWPGVTAGLLAAIALVLHQPQPPATDARSNLVAFEELIALDAALAPALVLLDSDNRDVLLHLPAASQL